MAEVRTQLNDLERGKMESFNRSVNQIVVDLGKVELQLSDLKSVKSQIMAAMTELVSEQNKFFAELETRYGKGLIDPKTMEYIVEAEQS